MGRRKIAIRPIVEERNRSVTFIKRKAGLFKKAHELAVLCQVDVALVILGPNGKIFEYATSSVEDIVADYAKDAVLESRGPRDYADLSGDAGAGRHSSRVSDDSGSDEETPPPQTRRTAARQSASKKRTKSVTSVPSTPATQTIQQGAQTSASSGSGAVDGTPAVATPPTSGKMGSPAVQPAPQLDTAGQVPPPLQTHLNQVPMSGQLSQAQLAQMAQAGQVGQAPQVGENQMAPMPGQMPGQMPYGQVPYGQMNIMQHMPPPRAGQYYVDYAGRPIPIHNQSPQLNQMAQLAQMNPQLADPAPQEAETPQSVTDGSPSIAGTPASTGGEKARPKLKVQIPGSDTPEQPNSATAAGAIPAMRSRPAEGAQSHVPAHAQAQAQMRLQMQAAFAHAQAQQAQQIQAGNSSGSSGGSSGPPSSSKLIPGSSAAARWSTYPQSPMGYLVSAQPDSARQQLIPQGAIQQPNQSESTPISAALPSRYMNDMLASPSTFFAMEWGVPWEGPTSALPRSAGPLAPGQQNPPPAAAAQPETTQSPVQYTAPAANASKRVANGGGPTHKKKQ